MWKGLRENEEIEGGKEGGWGVRIVGLNREWDPWTLRMQIL